MLTIAIVGIWVWVAIKVRHEYINSFKLKLTQADVEAKKALPDFTNVSVLEGLKRALTSGTENQILYVLEKVREIPDKRMFDNVVELLKHPSAQVREKALACLYYLRTNSRTGSARKVASRCRYGSALQGICSAT